jgi:hypothetical protein
MSCASKIFLSIIITALIVGGGVYFWQQKQVPNSPSVANIKTNEASANAWKKIIQYNCEQSGGSFKNDKCECPFEEQLGQTSEIMYDKNTGYCQTTAGGPGGELIR